MKTGFQFIKLNCNVMMWRTAQSGAPSFSSLLLDSTSFDFSVKMPLENRALIIILMTGKGGRANLLSEQSGCGDERSSATCCPAAL